MSDKSFTFYDGFSLFFGGGLASFLITHLYYRRQKREAAVDSRDLTVFLHLLWKQGARIEEYSARVEDRISSLDLQSLTDFQKHFSTLNTQLLDANLIKRPDDYLTTALTWKSLADRIAEERAKSGDFTVLDASGHLSRESLCSAHRAMFPTDYRWAGTWRDKIIQIMRSFTPTSTSRLEAMSSITIQPIPPEQITDAIERLLDRWNRNVHDLVNVGIESVIDAVARFHQEFILIHPFFDGNGRLGRVMMREQIRFTSGHELRAFEDREAYLSAMQAADAGSLDLLKSFIRQHINAR